MTGRQLSASPFSVDNEYRLAFQRSDQASDAFGTFALVAFGGNAYTPRIQFRHVEKLARDSQRSSSQWKLRSGARICLMKGE